MNAVGRLRRLEQWMIYVRWFGVVFGSIGIVIQPSYPDDATRYTAWGLLALLTVGNLLIWGFIARIPTDGDHDRLSAASFALDTVVIAGMVWVYAYEEPYVTWALLFLVPMEGALRYRLKGALLGAVIVALFFIPQSLRRADLTDGSFDFPTYVFLVGFSSLVAGITGSMANSWHEQNTAFRKQSLQLAELDRVKDRLLAITSHEIRGPLTAVSSGLGTMINRRDQLTDEQRASLEDGAFIQAQQLSRLVDDLLITSQLQSGKLSLQEEWTDLEPVIDHALKAAASKRKDHQLEVFVEPLHCEIDSARVSQIVRNLVENAFKYTPARTRVAVTCRPEGKGIVLEVADDGPGIPVEHRDRLFNAFTRIEETAAGQEGVGLGLYVVSHLAAEMGGRIDLMSSSRGTTFAIHIPCRTTAAGLEPRLDLVRDEDSA